MRCIEHTAFYQQLLGIESMWNVTDTETSLDSETVTVTVAYDRSEPLRCPKCGKPMPGYDSRPRRWRDLDSHRCKTWIVADVPRVACSEHGVQQVPVPWAESKARYTLRFEIMAIDLLKRAKSPGTVGEFLGISWGAVDRIMQRAVERGLMKRAAGVVWHLCVDETAVRRGGLTPVQWPLTLLESQPMSAWELSTQDMSMNTENQLSSWF